MSRLGTVADVTVNPASGAMAEATRAIHPECLMSVQDVVNDGPTTIHNGPALLFGIYVNTVLSAHTVLLKDGRRQGSRSPHLLRLAVKKTLRAHGLRPRWLSSRMLHPRAKS